MEPAARDQEVAALGALVDGLPARGGAVLVRGRRGHGKSTLLAAAERLARAREHAVLRVAGTHAEAAMPYAGVHQLLRPLRDEIRRLDAPLQEAVQALGPVSTAPATGLRAGVALLELLAAAAAARPVVVLVDDSHLLDRESLELLAFATRRVGGQPVVVVASVGDGPATVLDEAGLDEIVLRPLTPGDADRLAARVAPDLPDGLRGAVVREAQGNPLAIVELASAAAEAADDLLAFPGAELPVTPRLAELLRDDLDRVGPAGVTVLLAAALDPDASLDEVLAVAGTVCTERLTARTAGELVGAGVAVADANRLRPAGALTRVGLLAAVGPRRAHALHLAFAAHLRGGTTRQVLHRAAATIDPDEELAALVQAAAVDLRRRGRTREAARAFESAADLSVDPAAKVHRLLSASLLAFELGLPLAVRRLLDRAGRVGAAPEAWPLIAWQQRMLVGEWPPPDDAESVRLVEALVATPDDDAALAALMPLAIGCWWSDPSPRVRTAMRDGARLIATRTADPRVAAIAALSGPASASAEVRARIATLTPADLADPHDGLHLAIAAAAVGAWRASHRLIAPAVEQLRRRDSGGALAHALLYQGYAALRVGDWGLALAAAEESAHLAERASRPRQALGGLLLAARTAALVAPDDVAAELRERAAAGAARSGLPGALAYVDLAAACTALAAGRMDAVAQLLLPLFAAHGAAFESVRAGWEVLDVTEALVAGQRRDEARALVDRLAGDALQHPGSLAASAVACARPLLADGDAVGEGFAAALAQDLSGWPFLRARTLLAYGGWLHRRKRAAEAVPLLRGARDELAMLGATGLAERAGRELRAAGARGEPLVGATAQPLTPHELRIAQLAAGGLSNAQIGARLHVSARTVGSHLYRIFPKLGITSRGQLGQAIAREPV